MNVNSTSSYVNNPSSNKGFSGMASGMDTESKVEALLSGTSSSKRASAIFPAPA